MAEEQHAEMSGRNPQNQTLTIPNPMLTAAVLNRSVSQLSGPSASSLNDSHDLIWFFIAPLTTLWIWLCHNRIAVLGAIATFVGFVFGLAALVPAFAGQGMTEEALELARWTALKDYVEQCWERKSDGLTSEDCEKAMTASLPPPPHMDVDKQMDKLVARMPGFAAVNTQFNHKIGRNWEGFAMLEVSVLAGVYFVVLLAWLQAVQVLKGWLSHSKSAEESAPYVRLSGTTIDEERCEGIHDSIGNAHMSAATAYPNVVSAPFEYGHPALAKAEGQRAYNPLHGELSAMPSAQVGRPALNSTDGGSEENSPAGPSKSVATQQFPGPEHASFQGGVTTPVAVEKDADRRLKLHHLPRIRPRTSSAAHSDDEYVEKGLEKRLAKRFEPRSQELSIRRRPRNSFIKPMASTSRRGSVVSNASTGSITRVSREEYGNASSNAFAVLEGLEEEDEDVPDMFQWEECIEL